LNFGMLDSSKKDKNETCMKAQKHMRTIKK
jgi:hypothetical protein